MDPEPGSNSEVKKAQLGERLDSWKDIARYLNRSVRTLYRWEKEEGLPVHRHQHRELGSVFAYTAELDAWLNARRPDADRPAEDHQTAAPRRPTLAVALALVTVAAVVIGSTFYTSSRWSHRNGEPRSVPVAALELISSFAGSHRWPALSPDGRMRRSSRRTPRLTITTVVSRSGRRARFRPSRIRRSAPGSHPRT